ncbi:glycosyltransferase 87 family protein [Cellulomonas sp. 179-A 4D5 NHS]|uniref:glycosyltransferase 87 family protein n=1 Tax=Cellulomonas sp. 179-A 4D5 NHS TaxID=3142378 RepID=UPI00399F19DF
MRTPSPSLRSRVALVVAFLAVHTWLAWLGAVRLPMEAFYDLELYRFWMWQGLETGTWPVLDGDWVYPAGALVPLLVPGLVDAVDTRTYMLAWAALVTLLNGLALVLLLRPRRGASTLGAWWWLAFLAALGPVAMGRLDAVVAPLVVVALVLAAQHPAVASALLTVGAWIKVAPGALLLPLVLVTRRPWRDVVLPPAVVCAVVVGAVTLGGGLPHLGSFLAEQGERGLQVESVGATPWMVAALVTPAVERRLNEELVTYEVHGPGAQLAADSLGLALVLALAAVTALLWWARRRAGTSVAVEAFVVRGALLVATTLIVFNKVGSPQFVGWLAPPVVVALALRLRGWEVTAVLVLVIAGLTQIVFPTGYNHLLGGDAVVTLALVLRNVLLVALLAVTARAVVRQEGRPQEVGSEGTPPDSTAAIHASR